MIQDERYFNAPWGTLLKVISSLGTLVLLGVFGGIILSGRAGTAVTAVLYSAIPLLTLSISLLFTVRGYIVSGDSFRIRRLLWFTDTDISLVKSVEYDPKAMTGSLRTFGNGGLFSFSGSYKSGKLGSFKAYVTDFRNCVIIKTPDVTLVVSPENPELFVEVLRNHCSSR
ncbi:MAG: PH domain-containing protein [Candidatus Fermentibacteria bacterium]